MYDKQFLSIVSPLILTWKNGTNFPGVQEPTREEFSPTSAQIRARDKVFAGWRAWSGAKPCSDCNIQTRH